MTPTELIHEWIARFNAADIEGLSDLYADDALNEQVVFSKPLLGRKEIREMFRLEFSRAIMTCIEEQIYECEDTGILQWRDPNGLKGCGFFQIKDDKIIHQKGYFDQLSFFRAQGLPVPDDYLTSKK